MPRYHCDNLSLPPVRGSLHLAAAVRVLPFALSAIMLAACGGGGGGGGSKAPVADAQAPSAGNGVVTQPAPVGGEPPVAKPGAGPVAPSPLPVPQPAPPPAANPAAPPAVPAPQPVQPVPATSRLDSVCSERGANHQPGQEDVYAANSWHLSNTGPQQRVGAGDNRDAVAGIDARVHDVHRNGRGCTGHGISFVVADSGLETTHEDLSPNVLADGSFNFNTHSSTPGVDPQSLNEANPDRELDHGTAVAGVLAAKGWNGLGSRGIAPNATLQAFSPLNLEQAGNDAFVQMDMLRFGAYGLLMANPVPANLSGMVTRFGVKGDQVSVFNLSAGSDYASPWVPEPFVEPAQTRAAAWGVRHLREGRGAIYLQAAGNEFSDMRNPLLAGSQRTLEGMLHCHGESGYNLQDLAAPGLIPGAWLKGRQHISCGNANHDLDGQPYFLKIASVSASGKVSSYSNAGANLWVAGFGGEYGTSDSGPAIISTDNSGCRLGSNRGDSRPWPGQAARAIWDFFFGPLNQNDPHCNYTVQMNGTSAAAPSVAGVVALMLEANPKLTEKDVRYILARTARRVDEDIARPGTDHEISFNRQRRGGTVLLEDPWITNQAGFHFQNRYGFGLVDAREAVRMAIDFQPPAGRRLDAIDTEAVTPSLQDGNSTMQLDWDFAKGANGAVTGPLQVDFGIKTDLHEHSPAWASGMLFVLEHTHNGQTTRSVVMPPFTSWLKGESRSPGERIPRNDAAETKRMRFISNAFYGESLQGQWRLKIININNRQREGAPAFDWTVDNFRATSHGL